MRYLADYLQTAVFINKMWSIVPFGGGTQLQIICKNPLVKPNTWQPTLDVGTGPFSIVFQVYRIRDVIYVQRFRYPGGSFYLNPNNLALTLSDPQFIEKMAEWFMAVNHQEDTNLPEMRDVKVKCRK